MGKCLRSWITFSFLLYVLIFIGFPISLRTKAWLLSEMLALVVFFVGVNTKASSVLHPGALKVGRTSAQNLLRRRGDLGARFLP